MSMFFEFQVLKDKEYETLVRRETTDHTSMETVLFFFHECLLVYYPKYKAFTSATKKKKFKFRVIRKYKINTTVTILLTAEME